MCAMCIWTANNSILSGSVLVRKEQRCSWRNSSCDYLKYLIQLPFHWSSNFLPCAPCGNPPEWNSSFPKQHWQLAHSDGAAGAEILGKAPLKKYPDQVVVIKASYALFKKRLMPWPQTTVRLCCSLILEVCVIKSIEDLKTWKHNLKKKKKTWNFKGAVMNRQIFEICPVYKNINL